MSNYKVQADQRIVLTQLRRATGETVEAEPGEIVAVHPDDEGAESPAAAYVEAGVLKKTSEKATPWPRLVEKPAVDEGELAAGAELVKSVIAEQKAADKAAQETA